MEYPNDFDIASFPAGKTIALSRSVSIWILIVFFFIFVVCGFVIFTRSLKTNYPFLVSIDPFTDEWNVIAYPNKSENSVLQYEIIQEKLVNDFVNDWFTISANSAVNESRWKKCSVEECQATEQFEPTNINCGISCKSDESVFDEFQTKVLPQYLAMIDLAAETWKIKGRQFMPITMSEKESKWQVYLTVESAKMG